MNDWLLFQVNKPHIYFKTETVNACKPFIFHSFSNQFSFFCVPKLHINIKMDLFQSTLGQFLVLELEKSKYLAKEHMEFFHMDIFKSFMCT